MNNDYMKLFEPIKIGNVTIKNRLMVPAMVTRLANADGTSNEEFITYLETKAKGGWGLILPEDFAVCKYGGAYDRLPGLWDDKHIESHKLLTERVHNAGAKIFAQIYHAGRKVDSSRTGVATIAPSRIKDATTNEYPDELTVEQIKELISKFGNAALRAQKAGFDGVEIHGAHGYLISQFLSGASNKRTDEYGGSITRKCKFALDIIDDIRNKTGKDFPIIFRISAEDFLEGGLTLEETTIMVKLFERRGVDAIHCSNGALSTAFAIHPPSAAPYATYIKNARAFKEVLNIPVIAVGRIAEPIIAEHIISSGSADLVAMGRASLADPSLPNKIKNGDIDDISLCIGCMQGCTGQTRIGKTATCLVNLFTGHETEYKSVKVGKPKKVLIVGAGPAGLQAAVNAAKRGHDVTIYEKGDKPGGLWALASLPPGKTDFSKLLIWQLNQLKKLNVKIHTNTVADADFVKRQKPDILVIATGSKPNIPPIEGIGSDHVFLAQDILTGKVTTEGPVVVIGGGLVGAETAHFIASDNKNVTILEMLPQIVADGEPNPTYYLKKGLKERNVEIITSCKVKKISSSDVIITHDGHQKTIKAATVIIAAGFKPDKSLYEQCKGLAEKVICIGDANTYKNGFENIKEGFITGLEI